ncbi:hypothetical protein SeLEV6574_g02633 [Synchytrium endobioticum]|uniref:C2 domain-containing protein n=1 Tax=Synchytrium endobioticum TaxID=286115 RepID=A0A507D7Q6_9FUNG|nr:hypothetical protein SeLEV6574_g02633 [Synchytrium endobioticum]
MNDDIDLETLKRIKAKRRIATLAPSSSLFVGDSGQSNQSTQAPTLEQPNVLVPATAPVIPMPPPPQYVYLRVSTGRALAVLPPSPGSATLLSVSVRLFTPGSPIESAPVPYRAPFDLSTGKVGVPTDFDFVYTVPVPATPEFFKTHSGKPLILEIWAMETSNDDGPKLLGLVKLPLHALLAAAEARTLSSPPTQEAVLVPDAEYALVDPFTGTGKGWIKAFLAFASWSEIIKVKKSIAAHPQPRVESKHREESRAVGDQSRERVRKQQARKRNDIIDGEQRQLTQQRPRSEITLELTIHRACGLKPLVRSAASQLSSGTYGPLDHALEVGANP